MKRYTMNADNPAKMIRNLGFLLLLSLMLGRTAPVYAVEGVASYTVFYLPESGLVRQAYIDLYWQINPFSLHYRKNEQGQLAGQVRTDIIIRNDTGIVAEDHYLLHTDPAPPEIASTRNILELKRFRIPAGDFRVELKLTEPDFPNASFVYTEAVSVKAPDANIFYSGIQLIDTFYPAAQTDHAFFRNGLIQIPRATNFIDNDRTMIRYYAELYQSNLLDTSLYPLIQRAEIIRREGGGVLRNLQHADTFNPGLVIPLTGQFDLSSLASGNYHLNLRLHDRYNQELAVKTCFFQLLNKNPVLPDKQADDTTSGGASYLDISSTFVFKFTLPQIKAILEMLLPGSDALDRKAIESFLKRPDEMYMRYFVYNYFKKQNDKDPEKAWKAFSAQIREVNRMFGGSAQPGYKTDRGYIFMKYGKPNDRIVVNNEPGALPYEVWQYYSLGKQDLEGVFLFYQPGSAVNDYKLLHTTVNGDVRNPNWRVLLYTKGEGNGNANSRAEQYIRNR